MYVLCVFPCLCVCLCFCTITQKEIDLGQKLEYIVVYEISSDEFDIEFRQIKVKVTVGVKIFFPYTTIQTVRSYSSSLVQARNLTLSKYVHLVLCQKPREFNLFLQTQLGWNQR